MKERRAQDADGSHSQKLGWRRLADAMQRGDGIAPRVSALLAPAAPRIAEVFYRELLAVPEARLFLDHTLVEQRLRRSLEAWFAELFSERGSAGLPESLARQHELGHVHARMGIPLALISFAMASVRRECVRLLAVSDLERGELVAALDHVSELLSCVLDALTESYVWEVIAAERAAHALRLQALSQGLAIECERMRASLFDWQCRAVAAVYDVASGRPSRMPSVLSSDFGMWVTYKADVLFADNPEIVARLKEQLECLAADAAAAIAAAAARGGDTAAAIGKVDEDVTRGAWLLASLAQHAREMESGQDPLTRLFNRRYLPTVLQRAARVAMTQGVPFTILLFDIDDFKTVNDTHGHDAGDGVLTQFGELLAMHVRAGDFVFRYGGDEFLVLLSGVGQGSAAGVAEKLGTVVAEHRFRIGNGRVLPLTASVGVASTGGHPDYAEVVSRADGALLRAKQEGRARVVVSESE